MEKFYGSTLLFKTPKCTIKGILRNVDHKTNLVIIQDPTNNGLQKISILDIEDLQIIAMPNKKQFETQMENAKSSLKLNESLNKMSIAEKDCIKKNEPKLPVKRSASDSADKKMKTIVSCEVYKQALNDSINYYGPSKECLSFNTARNMCNFLESRKKESYLLVIEDSFYAMIGLHLCVMLHNKGFQFDVICNVRNDIRYAEIIQFYKNNGGNFDKQMSSHDNIILFGSGDIEYKYSKTCYIFERKNERNCQNEVLFMLGIISDSINTFTGSVYLLDCNLSKLVYKKYGIKNKCSGDILQIKTSK